MNLIDIITPINLKEEKLKFFSDLKYHPVFEYKWQNKKINIKAEGLKPNLIKSIIEQDINSIIKNAGIYFDISAWSYLQIAKNLTKNAPLLISNETNQDFINLFYKTFKFLGLNEYKVKLVDEVGFNFRPSVKNKEIVMSKYANFQFFSAEGEVRHELVHIIRYENGRYNNILSSSNYLPTEEGLATLMQDTSLGGVSSEFQHAAEYIASYVGSSGSLRDIFEYLLSIGFNPELAWQRACRHKFGLVNTKEAGDILKPAMYFANSQKIRSFDNHKILKLFMGRIAMSESDKYDTYKGIIDMAKITQFYNLK